MADILSICKKTLSESTEEEESLGKQGLELLGKLKDIVYKSSDTDSESFHAP